MCGIAGVIGPGNNTPVVQSMLNQLAHRGPDAAGIQVSGQATIGHRRLAVIDTSSAANQPFCDDTKRFWLTYNGELYNYLDVKRQLQAEDVTFRTASDTEVVLRAFMAWGEDCLARFNGMFAFAIWDQQTRRLFLARDRLGEKPLFYASTPDGHLLFASEPQVLACHPGVGKSLSLDGLATYLQYNYNTGTNTLWQGVRRFPAAHCAWVEAGQTELTPRLYWDLAACFRNKSDKPANTHIDELNALLEDSVRLRLQADVPFGAFLSGGIDSSSIVAAMTRQIGVNATRAFSVGFASKTFDELEYATLAADHLGVDLTSRDYRADADVLIDALQTAAREPLADTSILPMQLLSRMTRESVTVALSGDGADELLLGYPTHLADRLHHVSAPWLGWAAPAINRLASALPTSFAKVSFDYKARQWAGGLGLSAERAHAHWREIFSADTLSGLAHADLARTLPTELAFAEFEPHFTAVSECHYLDQMSYVDIKTWLVDDILVKVDRATMAHSLESRAPFLDHRLVEFAAMLPVSEKLKGTNGKHILKRAQRPHLPATILSRGKRGFNAPLAEWINGPLDGFVNDMLSGQALRSLFRAEGLDIMLAEHRRAQRDHSLQIFALLLLGLWLETQPGRSDL